LVALALRPAAKIAAVAMTTATMKASSIQRVTYSSRSRSAGQTFVYSLDDWPLQVQQLGHRIAPGLADDGERDA
jgi:hypothetical protein